MQIISLSPFAYFTTLSLTQCRFQTGFQFRSYRIDHCHDAFPFGYWNNQFIIIYSRQSGYTINKRKVFSRCLVQVEPKFGHFLCRMIKVSHIGYLKSLIFIHVVLVEARGVEPLSENLSSCVSTGVALELIMPRWPFPLQCPRRQGHRFSSFINAAVPQSLSTAVPVFNLPGLKVCLDDAGNPRCRNPGPTGGC